MDKISCFIKKDPVLLISGLLAVVSAFFVPPDVSYLSYIDFRVLALLFCLMCVMNGFQEIGLFQKLAVFILSRTKNTRQLTAVLVFLCFFLSMFITNDVSLITFVPFTILILTITGQAKLMIYVIVLQTIAANLGSMLTPVGNPQNLYLYSLSGMRISLFLKTMLPYTLLSGLLLFLSLFLKPGEKVSLQSVFTDTAPMERKPLLVYSLLFMLCLGCVLRLFPWQALLLILFAVLLPFNRRLLYKADYGLLFTFLFFFLFIGNMGRIPVIVDFLRSVLTGHELFLSIAASQVISNVPAAILLSGFTGNYLPLLAGVNIGGLGTLIASLASLISYKQYAKTAGCHKGRYLLRFTGLNLLFLAVLSGLAVILI
nr:SLC13 family permease [uncultured Eisenbergiella sp.]